MSAINTALFILLTGEAFVITYLVFSLPLSHTALFCLPPVMMSFKVSTHSSYYLLLSRHEIGAGCVLSLRNTWLFYCCHCPKRKMRGCALNGETVSLTCPTSITIDGCMQLQIWLPFCDYQPLLLKGSTNN